MEPKKFEYLDRTADIMFVAFGKTLKNAFVNSALAYSNSVVDITSIEEKEKVTIEITSESIESLLYDFLEKILFENEVNKIVFGNFEIKNLKRTIDEQDKDAWYIKCECRGEKFDSKKHKVDSYVKAITYSDMKIERKNGLFQIQVVLDI